MANQPTKTTAALTQMRAGLEALSAAKAEISIAEFRALREHRKAVSGLVRASWRARRREVTRAGH